MANSNRPLLAEKLTVDQLSQLRYPLYASPKFDGIRVRVDEKLRPLSRKNILIPNLHFQNTVRAYPEWTFLDGEVVTGKLGSDQFNQTQSSIMSRDGNPDFIFWVFDCFEHPDRRYQTRFLDMLIKVKAGLNDNKLKIVEQIIVNNSDEVLAYETAKLNEGYEGIILRSPHGRYKFGRSTLKEQILLKLKRFTDAEAVIVGVNPLEHNNNAAMFDELGYTKRSSHKHGKQVDELMGALEVRAEGWSDTFSVGSGFNLGDREWFWTNKEKVIGRTISFKFQETGALDAPRFPIYKGIRND